MTPDDLPDNYPRKRDALTTLIKGLDAVRALNTHPLLTAQEMAALLGVPRTTARRLLDTLVLSGVASKAANDSHYRLAPGAADLSSGLSESEILAHVAGPILRAATDDIGWTLSLVTLADEAMVLQVTTARTAAYAITYFPIGHSIPVYASNAGQVVLAYREDAEAAAERLITPAVDGSLKPAAIREQGYYAPVVARARESHLYVPLLLDDHAPGCLIMRYLVSAVPRRHLLERHVPYLQDIAGRIVAGTLDAMRDRVPAWTQRWPADIG